MFKNDKKVTIEWINGHEESYSNKVMSNPISMKSTTNNLSTMVATILDEELPMLKNNSLLHGLVMYTVMEKLTTVQTVENVLSYIKDNNGKKVHDISFKNGEVRIKCST